MSFPIHSISSRLTVVRRCSREEGSPAVVFVARSHGWICVFVALERLRSDGPHANQRFTCEQVDTPVPHIHVEAISAEPLCIPIRFSSSSLYPITLQTIIREPHSRLRRCVLRLRQAGYLSPFTRTLSAEAVAAVQCHGPRGTQLSLSRAGQATLLFDKF